MEEQDKKLLIGQLVHKHFVAENVYKDPKVITGYQLAVKDAIVLIGGNEAYKIERQKSKDRNLRRNDVGTLSFVTINVDGKYRQWHFDSIEELRKEYHKEDYDLAGNDDPVTEMEFCGIPMYVNTFDDIVRLFGIEEP